MKDNAFFKTCRGVQRVSLSVSPFVAAVLTWKGELQLAVGVLAAWAMIVTAMLTITKPKGS
jgi:hypothetical protein